MLQKLAKTSRSVLVVVSSGGGGGDSGGGGGCGHGRSESMEEAVDMATQIFGAYEATAIHYSVRVLEIWRWQR